MVRKLLIFLCFFGVTHAVAQVSITPITATEHPEGAKIDYKQMGAPMPPILLVRIHDTAKKNDSALAAAADKNQGESKKTRKKRKQDEEMQRDMAKEYITEKDLDNGVNLFVMMFNPTCSHCEEETQMLEKNIKLFKKTKLVLMANKVMRPYLPDFTARFHTDKYAPIIVGADSSGFIDNTFLYQMLPQINIYNSERKLIKTYNGDVAIDSLKRYIE